MKFSGSLIAIFFHALIILVLSFFIPLLEPFSWKDASHSAIIILTVLIIGHAITILRFRFLKKRQDISHYIDLSVFLFLWTGLNQLAFKTRYPPVSVRNYPEISKFFPVFFVLGIVIIVLTSSKQWKFIHKAWLVAFMMTSLPYTHPLDHYTLSMCFPLMLLLYATHRETKTISVFFQNPFFRYHYLSTAAFFIVQLLISLNNDFDQVVPDFLFYATIFFTLPLVWSAVKNDKNSTHLIVKKAVAGQVILMLFLAIIWIVWTASRWGALSILKYRLWISLIHPNALAACLAVSFLVLEPWKKQGKNHVFIWTISICALVMLLLTQSRGMIFALLLSFLIINFNLLQLFRKLENKQQRLVTFVVLACLGLSVIIYWRVHYRLLTIGMIQDRITLWKASWNGIKAHLLSGLSFGSKGRLAEFVTDPFCAKTEFLRLWMDWDRLGKHFHNFYIEILWLFGLPGLLLFMLVIYKCFNKIQLNKMYPGVVMATMALLLFGLFDCPIYYAAIMFLGATLLGLISGSSFELKNAEKPLSTAQKILSVLPAMMAVSFLLLTVVPVFHQRFLYARGIHLSNHNIDKSKTCLKAAANFRPASGKTVEKLVRLMLDNGECIEATSALDTYMLKTNMPTIQLMRLHAWLERDSTLRLKRLQNAWHSDPAGLKSENLSFEVFLMELQSDSFELSSDIIDNLLADRNFYILLRDHGSESPNGLTIDKQTVTNILNARGLNLFPCNIQYSSVFLSLEDMLTTMEKVLTNCDENIDRCNKKRQAYFLAMLKARDFGRATRTANSWSFDLSETQLIADVQTFREGSSAYSIIQARRALGIGDYQLAEQHLLSASTGEKSNPEWFYMMSIVLGKRHIWKLALENINSALRSAPHDVRFLMEKGTALYHLGQLPRALEVFQTIVCITPWSVKAQSYTGIILYELERFEESVLYFESARDLTPEDPQAYFNLFMALTALPDRKDDAKKLRETIVQRFDEVAIPEDLKERIFNEDNGKR